MAYVALSRVRDLNNLQLVNVNTSEKGWQPNDIALEFYNTGKTISSDQMLFISDTKKQIKNVRRLKWSTPIWNHIYIDFETYLDGCVQKTYYNHLLHIHGDKTVAKLSFFDQLWQDGVRCDVSKATWEYIRDIAINYGDDMSKLKGIKDKIAVYKNLKKQIPTIIGYNLSGFDLHFIVQ